MSEIRDKISDIIDAEDAGIFELTSWEAGFIESVLDRETISPAQAQVINKIWDKIE